MAQSYVQFLTRGTMGLFRTNVTAVASCFSAIPLSVKGERNVGTEILPSCWAHFSKEQQKNLAKHSLKSGYGMREL